MGCGSSPYSPLNRTTELTITFKMIENQPDNIIDFGCTEYSLFMLLKDNSVRQLGIELELLNTFRFGV